MSKYAFCLLALIVVTSCATFKTYEKRSADQITPSGKPYFSVFLVGNTNANAEQSEVSRKFLAQRVEENSSKSAILVLGNFLHKDVILQGETEEDISQAADFHLDFYKQLDARSYFITGPHEWDNGSRRGNKTVDFVSRILEEEEEDAANDNAFFPAKGCPGPEEIHVNDDVVLLLLNTQWLLHEWDKPAFEEGCEVNNEIEFYSSLDNAIKRNFRKKIIVAGHHSLFSSGEHGGYFPPKAHLFPFTLRSENLYLPLPVAGSLFLGFRNWFGGHQDLKNYKYARMRKSLSEIFSQHKNLIYASAHDATLEYHQKNDSHFVNSGSFSKSAPIGGQSAAFSSSAVGFASLDLYRNGEVRLAFWSGSQPAEGPLYTTLLFKMELFDEEDFEESVEEIDYSDSTANGYATKSYLKDNDRPGMMGQNYRKEWAAEIHNVRVFDLGKEKGGMKIEKMGGGMQTKSLRLVAADDKEYVLRSIEKFPEKAVPLELRGTFAEHLIAEQISASHPYGAFAIPTLADAAGIYHTNPEIVYLPDDPRLGIYRQNFASGLYLFEERPDGDRSDVAGFGRSEDITSTAKVLEKIVKDGDHKIDQHQVVKSRLFDILIGDWDRHEDQWRWAKFKRDDDIKLYRPIPRDRDNVFFWSDGWLMKVGTRRWGLPKFQGFHHKIRDVEGMNFNARHFDRTFMNEPTLEDWLALAGDIQQNLTDKAIEQAIRKMPSEIFELHGQEIIEKLKSRREDLKEYATEYYLFLAKTVNITGTKERDLFLIERLNDEQTKVTGYRIKGKSEEIKYKLYERIFNRSETKEIRIFGLGDDDIFKLSGNVNAGIKVRIIGGGGGDDLVENESIVKGLEKKTVVYDKKSGMKLIQNHDTRDKRSNDREVNSYDRTSYQYNLATPLLYGGFNPDDGIFLGLGTVIRTHGFRKDPYKSRHFIVGNVAPKSASFNFSYKGTFTEVLGKWNVNINTSLFYPSYSDFFYGFGNESNFSEELRDRDVRYYAARYQQIRFNPEIFKNSRNLIHRFTIGADYQLINVKESRNDNDGQNDRFIHECINTVQHRIFDDWRQFASAYVKYERDTRNNNLYPLSGTYFQLKTGYTRDVDDNAYEVNFSATESQFSWFYTFGNTLRSTLALRVGGAVNAGDYEFYHANTLGGSENLRGYRKQRFAGDMTFYQNSDLRVRLFSFRTIVLPGDFGLVFFHDVGRVWMDDDPSVPEGSSELWHRGYGAGFYVAPFGKAALTFDYSASNTGEAAFFVRLGFLF